MLSHFPSLGQLGGTEIPGFEVTSPPGHRLFHVGIKDGARYKGYGRLDPLQRIQPPCRGFRSNFRKFPSGFFPCKSVTLETRSIGDSDCSLITWFQRNNTIVYDEMQWAGLISMSFKWYYDALWCLMIMYVHAFYNHGPIICLGDPGQGCSQLPSGGKWIDKQITLQTCPPKVPIMYSESSLEQACFWWLNSISGWSTCLHVYD